VEQWAKNPLALAIVSGIIGKAWDTSVSWLWYAAMLCLLVFAGWQWLQLPQGARSRLEGLLVLSLTKRISLRTAAILVYDEALEGPSLLATAAERMRLDKTPDGTLNYIADFFIVDGIQIWGRRPPARRLRAISPEKLAGARTIEGATILIIDNDASHAYEDLYVQSKDIKRVIDELPSKFGIYQ
jgi:hypothetical protein